MIPSSPHATLVYHFHQHTVDLTVGTTAQVLRTYHAMQIVHPLDWQVETAFPSHLDKLHLAGMDQWQQLDVDSQSSLWTPHDLLHADARSTSSLLATSQRWKKDHLDLMELFGGKAGCSTLAIRRNLRAGTNVDWCQGYDVCNPRTRHEILQTIRLTRPKVIIMAPTCTAFSGWARLNQLKASHQHQRSLQNGIACSRFAAAVAEEQLRHHRHYVLENPAGSSLFTRPEWVMLRRRYQLHEVVFPQCAVGLVSPGGRPIKKMTVMWASDLRLVRGLQGMECQCQVPHQVIEGSERGHPLSSWAQQWPLRLCHRLISGVITLLKEDYSLPIHQSRRGESYPTQEEVARGGPPSTPTTPVELLDPERPSQVAAGTEHSSAPRVSVPHPSAPTTPIDLLPPAPQPQAPPAAPPTPGRYQRQFGCPACKRNAVMTHTDHTRHTEGRLRCRHPYVQSIPRRCPGCQISS